MNEQFSSTVTVPRGKSLVVTGLGNSTGSPTFLLIDDVSIWYTGALNTPASAHVPPPGIVAPEGSVVRVAGYGTGRAIGYYVANGEGTGEGPYLESTRGPSERPPTVLRVAGIPDPVQAMLLLEEDPSMPFEVPQGKKLVITGLGAGTNGNTLLLINNGVAWNNGSSGYEVPAPGVVVEAGLSVSLSNNGRALGYLIDE